MFRNGTEKAMWFLASGQVYLGSVATLGATVMGSLDAKIHFDERSLRLVVGRGTLVRERARCGAVLHRR